MFLGKKTTNYKEKVQTKSAKTAISGIFGRKKISSEIGLGHILSISLSKKKRKNWWWNLKKLPKNCFFRHICSIFGRKNMFFKNRALSNFRSCHFASVCKIPWKILKLQLEKFKKYHFSGENRLLRRFLESSGYKNQFYWQ